jgi:tetratricopeptide (TPR) repeat protein
VEGKVLRWRIILGLLGLLIARVALAQSSVEQAREHYRKGTAAYNLGHYAEAAREYEATYELTLDAAALFNTAQAYRLAGETQKAILAYKGYLRAAPQGPQREVAQQKLDELNRTGSAGAASPPAAPAAGIATTPPSAGAAEVTAPLAAAPPTATAPAALVGGGTPPPGAERPIYERWPFWVVTGAVVAGAVVLGIVLASSNSGLSPPSTTYGSMNF